MEVNNFKAEIRKINTDSKCRYGVSKIYSKMDLFGHSYGTL